MNRRGFLKEIAIWTSAIVLSKVALDKLLFKRGTVEIPIRRPNRFATKIVPPLENAITLEDLEKYALKTQEGKEISFSSEPSNGLDVYNSHFQYGFGSDYLVINVLKRRQKKYPYDKSFLVADIGGAAGTAAYRLDMMEGIDAFVIDPLPRISTAGERLSKERFIVKKIEDTGLPDNSFHFMMSHATHESTQLPKSFTEVYRLLKPQGFALIQYQSWYQPEIISALDALEIKNNIAVASNTPYGPRTVTLDDFIKRFRNVEKQLGKEGAMSLAGDMQPTFFIAKIYQ